MKGAFSIAPLEATNHIKDFIDVFKLSTTSCDAAGRRKRNKKEMLSYADLYKTLFSQIITRSKTQPK